MLGVLWADSIRLPMDSLAVASSHPRSHSCLMTDPRGDVKVLMPQLGRTLSPALPLGSACLTPRPLPHAYFLLPLPFFSFMLPLPRRLTPWKIFHSKCNKVFLSNAFCWNSGRDTGKGVFMEVWGTWVYTYWGWEGGKAGRMLMAEGSSFFKNFLRSLTSNWVLKFFDESLPEWEEKEKSIPGKGRSVSNNGHNWMTHLENLHIYDMSRPQICSTDGVSNDILMSLGCWFLILTVCSLDQ